MVAGRAIRGGSRGAGALGGPPQYPRAAALSSLPRGRRRGPEAAEDRDGAGAPLDREGEARRSTVLLVPTVHFDGGLSIRALRSPLAEGCRASAGSL